MYRSRLTSLKLLSIGVHCLSLGLGLSLCPSATWASQSCKRFIPSLAAEFGIPVKILRAIAEVESKFEPYALNHAGKSLRFSVPQEALKYVETQIQRGETNLDVGCMQINWRVHQKNFESPKDLLNPEQNVRYAAQFLRSLYQELGTWAKAVVAYHSRKSKHSDSYLIKIAKSLTGKSLILGKINNDDSHTLSHGDRALFYSVRRRIQFSRNRDAVSSESLAKDHLFISDGRVYHSGVAHNFWSLLSAQTPTADILWQRPSNSLY